MINANLLSLRNATALIASNQLKRLHPIPLPPPSYTRSLCAAATPTASAAGTSTTEAAAAATINCHHFLESFHALHFTFLPPCLLPTPCTPFPLPPGSPHPPISHSSISFSSSASLEAQPAVIFSIISTEILCVMHPMFASHAPPPQASCGLVYASVLPCCLLRCKFRYKRR